MTEPRETRVTRTDQLVVLHPDTTAAVLVEIVPIGVPGQVAYRIGSVGPMPVQEDEAARILRAAVEVFDLPAAADRMTKGTSPRGDS